MDYYEETALSLKNLQMDGRGGQLEDKSRRERRATRLRNETRRSLGCPLHRVEVDMDAIEASLKSRSPVMSEGEKERCQNIKPRLSKERDKMGGPLKVVAKRPSEVGVNWHFIKHHGVSQSRELSLEVFEPEGVVFEKKE